MAPRTSLYANALKMPEWVFGGDYGDLSKVMNQRDISYETVAQNEIATEGANLKLEEAQRQERMREILNDRMGSSRPATIRDAYQQMAEAAYEAGDPSTALEYESKGEAFDQAQLNKKRAEFASALGIADNASYGRVNEMYPGVLTQDDYARNQKSKRAAKEEKTKVLYGPDGTPEQIPQAAYNKYISAGYIDPTLDDRDVRQIRSDFEKAKGKGDPGSSGLLDDLTPFERKGDSFPSQAKAKGDTARLAQPSVEDEVKVIKRKRSVEGRKTLRG